MFLIFRGEYFFSWLHNSISIFTQEKCEFMNDTHEEKLEKQFSTIICKKRILAASDHR